MSTLDFYDTNAAQMSEAYEQVDFSRVPATFAERLTAGARVLDIGCGSGRDAAALLARRCNVAVVDGSGPMLAEAVRRHPELEGRTHQLVLPGRLPFQDETFDGITAWAVIMHLFPIELSALFTEIARVAAPNAVFAYSVNTARSGLDPAGNDSRGRHFTCMSATVWESFHRQAGFITDALEETDDITGRPGIRWATFITRRG